MKFLVNSLAAGAGSVIGTQVSLRVGQQRAPHPMPHQFAPLLDHGLRLRYRDPLETLGLFGIAPGMTVLDLGCGTGLFTAAMARMVGPTGTVHAVDVQQPMLDATAARLAAATWRRTCTSITRAPMTCPCPTPRATLPSSSPPWARFPTATPPCWSCAGCSSRVRAWP
ncbi:MAG: methyltransferase domain-containing protein [Caldilineaceae bacterium]